MSSEFDLIGLIQSRVRAYGLYEGVVLGIGDDAAVMQPSQGMQLVATADNLVQGRHFDARAGEQQLGHLALAVNLSDLAAMGAVPRWSLLTLTMPEPDAAWLEGFLEGYLALSTQHDCALVGGNITRGPLNIAVTALGEVPEGKWISRAGAEAGDGIFVTGTLGDAAAGLLTDQPELRQRWLMPTPRIQAGLVLAESAHCMIDVSDGLLADLSHLLGGLGAAIQLDDLPTSSTLRQQVSDAADRWPLQLNGGGDYELLAVLPGDWTAPDRIGNVPLTRVGQVTHTGRIECIDVNGHCVPFEAGGWDHFKA